MKIRINIIPEKVRKERALRKKMGDIIWFGYKTFFVFIFFLVILISIRIILDIEYRAIIREPQDTGSIDMDFEENEKMLNDASKISKGIDKSHSEISNWSIFFEKISSACPSGLKIKSIHVELLHVKLSGFSKTRDDFISFENKLESMNMKNTVPPELNLTAPENFDFEMEFDIEKNSLIE